MMSALGYSSKPLFRIGRYRRGVAAYVANRSQVPFFQCLEIVEWNWPILVDAYDAGERFQYAGHKILDVMRIPVSPRASSAHNRSQGDSPNPNTNRISKR